MKRTGKYNASKPAYRFRIWTRKSYSVFNSLGRLISIGHLSTALSERIGTKAECGKLVDYPAKSNVFEKEAETPPFTLPSIEEVLALLTSVVLFQAVTFQDECSCCNLSIAGSPDLSALPALFFASSYFTFSPNSPFLRRNFSRIYSLINNKSQTIFQTRYRKVTGLCGYLPRNPVRFHDFFCRSLKNCYAYEP